MARGGKVPTLARSRQGGVPTMAEGYLPWPGPDGGVPTLAGGGLPTLARVGSPHLTFICSSHSSSFHLFILLFISGQSRFSSPHFSSVLLILHLFISLFISSSLCHFSSLHLSISLHILKSDSMYKQIQMVCDTYISISIFLQRSYIGTKAMCW